MAINLIITGITKLVNKQKELRESISETAEEAKKQTDSLNSLIKSSDKFWAENFISPQGVGRFANMPALYLLGTVYIL